jgi:chromosome partitioning protein
LAEILIGAELQRIDEDGGDHLAPAPPRFCDQARVAGVERAHRGHQRHRRAAARSSATAARNSAFPRMICTAFWPPLQAWRKNRGGSFAGPPVQLQVVEEDVCMAVRPPHIITFANEKGGTGKSTTAVHTAVALASMGQRVVALDLDTRQRTLGRYLDNRAATQRRLTVPLPMVTHETFDPAKNEPIEAMMERVGAEADVLVIDTPGRDDPHAREAMARADTLVTPINDSFVDLDLIGEVDPETYKVRRPSFYAEVVWKSRTRRAKTQGASVDWVLLRNRLQHVEARNMRRVADALGRPVPPRGLPGHSGLGERVIYRELVPQGPDPARFAPYRRGQHRPHHRAPGAARDGGRPGHPRRR